MTQLYRHFDSDGQLLYVGISINALNRYKEHASTEWFPEVAKITVERYPNRKDAISAEVAAIKAEKPRFNVRHLVTKSRKAREKTPDLIKIINVAIKKLGSQAEVARRLEISPQRLNNWLTSEKLPSGWEFRLEARLGVNGSKGSKRRGNGHSQRG